ncbi:MAG: hypothetical protein SGJ21_00445 [Alphaproteobacteria bacterium]|nr:hypothetical protein [Alphaproteobacteria bacterium]
MRVVIVVLVLVALASAGIWALAQFGGSPDAMVAEETTPTAPVSETEIVLAPAEPPTAPAAPVEPDLAPSNPPPPPPAVGETPAVVNDPSSLESARPSEDVGSAASGSSADALVSPRQAPPLPDVDASSEASRMGQAAAAQPPADPSFATTSVPAAPASLATQFKTRKVAYNRPPRTLFLDRPIDISLVIDATESANPAADLQGFPGDIVERDVDLSDTVSAQLTGVGFDIVSQTVARQNLSGRLANRWQWRVTPTEPGERLLFLEIFGYAAGSLDAEPLDAYRDEISVEVRQLDQVIGWARGVQPIFAIVAAVAGLLSALLAFMRFRAEKKRSA